MATRSEDVAVPEHVRSSTAAAYSAPGATTSTTLCDERERPSEVVFHDPSDALVSRGVFSRDEEGRVLSERMEFAGHGGLLGPAIDANMPRRPRVVTWNGKRPSS